VHYDGSMVTHFRDQNGYDDAFEACTKEFNGSHVCTTAEVGLIAQTDSLFIVPFASGVRFIDMSYGIEPTTKKPVNDCRGFTMNTTDYYSACLTHRVGGPILPAHCICTMSLSFICCKNVPALKKK